MRRCIGALGLLLAAIGAFSASPAAADEASACPASASEIPVEALYGQWDARFGGSGDVAKVRLTPHPDYAGSVRGTIGRGGLEAQLSGDIDNEGFLILDESQDGRSISAVWSGEMQPGSCGKEFKGTWRNSSDDSTQPFMLRKTGNP
ncbi:MAG: hypothetical protein EOP79_11940 [Variovorax sp.]|nr:MAG: hypothetical protein EOP79_11940 [Variovorax sp.]